MPHASRERRHIGADRSLPSTRDQQGVTFDDGRWEIEARSPRITAPVAFLTSGWAISYAETYMGIVERYRLAEIVGGGV